MSNASKIERLKKRARVAEARADLAESENRELKAQVLEALEMVNDLQERTERLHAMVWHPSTQEHGNGETLEFVDALLEIRRLPEYRLQPGEQ